MERFSSRELARVAALITEYSSTLRRAGLYAAGMPDLGTVDMTALADDAELLTRAATAVLSVPLARLP